MATGEELGRNVAAVAGQLSSAGGPGAGWATSAALTSAGQGWRDFLDGLAGRTAQAGRSLITAADNYRASDQRAAGRHGGRAAY